ncbi:MAG TPA: 2-hydroxyacyl-CoA dehydratase family protein [Bacillota bacterium]|jgi:benzoyl-CoA reductase/2-hydroxyglutaryl-CoA dehydratase subunit BcrC/BadD/HgdB|nr:hypothetical protein [Bacillota bacterium]HPU61983.1 2-hydroxyacyl-CoA dehydratase family protein [Bacillota bacterium]
MACGGNTVIHLACSYIPYEIPLAAGIPAARGIFEGPLPSMEGYLPRDFCPYARAFIRNYKDDTVVIAESCDAMRRVYDVLRYWNLARRVYFVDVPRTCNKDAVSFYAEELKRLAFRLIGSQKSLCQESKDLRKPQGLEELQELAELQGLSERLMLSMATMNEIRKEVSQVFRLVSKGQLSAAKGIEIAVGVNQALANPGLIEEPSAFVPGGILTQRIKEMTSKATSEIDPPNRSKRRIPVGVTGTCLLDPSLIECIENAGLDVVFIDSCIPLRTLDFIIDIKEKTDPFHVLAEAYLSKVPCPRMFKGTARIEHLYKLASDHGVKGLIYSAPKFCDQAYYDFIEIKHGLREMGMGYVLLLESDYGVGRTGQVLTRVEAFREILESV